MLPRFKVNNAQFKQHTHSINKTHLSGSKMKTNNKQRGFTLVTVLILSSLASILVLNSLKDNVNQERLSGNFQKKINSRLASERGVFDSMAAARTFLSNNQSATLEDIVAHLNAGQLTDTISLTNGGIKYTVTPTAVAGELVLSSIGNRFEGESALKVRLKVTPGGGGSPFADAVVGCEGVNLSGSGRVDSYNSNNAPYDINNPGKEGDVSTIDKNGANVILGGNSPILGDVSSTGQIDTKTSDVDGNLHANGDIIIGSGTGSGQVTMPNPDPNAKKKDKIINLRVSGNIRTRGNYIQNGGHIGGHVRANGDGYMTWSNFIHNRANDGLDILYGGTGTFKDTANNKHYENTQYKVFPDVEKVKTDDATAPNYKPNDPATNCDHLGISDIMDTIDNGNSNLLAFNSPGSGVTYTMDPYELYDGNNPPYASSVNETVLGKQESVIKLQSFNLTGSDTLNITGGDVTLFVEGDFKMAGATKINIAAGSTLTLMIKGTIDLGAGADIIAKQHGLAPANDPDSKPAMSIYSSYAGPDIGVKLSGDFETYAAIYAPKSDVNIAGSGTLYGSVRGKTVTVTGGAGIHYDAALGDRNRGGSSSSGSKISFLGWQY